jgi:hypothetical protein
MMWLYSGTAPGLLLYVTGAMLIASSARDASSSS